MKVTLTPEAQAILDSPECRRAQRLIEKGVREALERKLIANMLRALSGGKDPSPEMVEDAYRRACATLAQKNPREQGHGLAERYPEKRPLVIDYSGWVDEWDLLPEKDDK